MGSKYVLSVWRSAVAQSNPAVGHTLTTWPHKHAHSHLQINKWLHFCMSHSVGRGGKFPCLGYPPLQSLLIQLQILIPNDTLSKMSKIASYIDLLPFLNLNVIKYNTERRWLMFKLIISAYAPNWYVHLRSNSAGQIWEFSVMPGPLKHLQYHHRCMGFRRWQQSVWPFSFIGQRA